MTAPFFRYLARYLVMAAVPVLAVRQSPAAELTMKGKVVLVTGSTDGLGREVARAVGSLGARVIVHGRNRERGEAVVQEIAREGKGSARFYAADFASLAGVRRFAEAVLHDYDRLDVLVNNAGVWVRDRQTSEDGHELNLAVNYLAPFLLTRTLLPKLLASAPARVVNVASIAQSPIDFDDLMLERPGRAAQGYGQSKLALIMMTIDLASELKDRNVTVVALHPATMMDTAMVRQTGMPARTTVDEGKAAVMNLVVGKSIETGQYYNGLTAARANAQAYDGQARTRLREISTQLTSGKVALSGQPQQALNESRVIYETVLKAIARGPVPSAFLVGAEYRKMFPPGNYGWQQLAGAPTELRDKIAAAVADTTTPAAGDVLTKDLFPAGATILPNAEITALIKSEPIANEGYPAILAQYNARFVFYLSKPVSTTDGLDVLVWYSKGCGRRCGDSGYVWLHRTSRREPWTAKLIVIGAA